MPAKTNENFERLLKLIGEMGDRATQKASELPDYQKFIRAFPLSRLESLTADEYCVGKGGDTFCRWLERGLEPVFGRYMPGTSRGHVIYFAKSDGSLYKNRRLSDLSDEEALRYVLKVLATIASADPTEDVRWIDDDSQVYERAGVEPRVTMGNGRKLRVLAAYHPDVVIPICASPHVGHFLEALGCSAEEIPRKDEPVARMLKLREYFDLARQTHSNLSTRGFMLALYDPSLGIAPEDEEDDDEEGPSPAYLLTWNPEHFEIGGDGAIEPGAEHSWTCHSKQPKVGDIVYLARLGVEPRGIIARGTVTEGSYQAPHWKDPNKSARYIKFRVDELRSTAAAGLLPMVLLNMAIPEQKWSPQSSGVGIPAEPERVLRSLWESGDRKHSLRQVVDWLTRGDGSTAEIQTWLQRYKKTVSTAHRLRTDPGNMSEQDLDEMWRAPDNGVSHVGPGTLSNKEFAENLALLRDFTRRILASPTSRTLTEIEASWEQAVDAKRMRMVNQQVIRRVLAATNPRQFTTLLREADCQKTLALFGRQFELSPAQSAGADWIGLNADVTACMAMAGLDPERAEENNVAVWKLLQQQSAATSSRKRTEQPGLQPEPVVPRTAVAPRNLVLYGPPGTGKTYQTIEEAVGILAPELLEGEPNRTAIKARFDELVAQGRIVFTTFHQSFSYEDFVEGLRAETDDQGRLRYSVADGVFKKLCKGGLGSHDSNREGVAVPFQAGEEINGYLVLRCTPDILELKKPNGNNLPLGTSLLDQLVSLVRSGRISLEDIKQKQVIDKAPDEGLEPFLVNGYNTILAPIVERVVVGSSEASGEATSRGDDAPRVIIIDELNRGNVARIFGELITLIEPTTRAGMPEALSVTLPYSKERFSVPKSLHIVATMNTADRSLVGLDIALRRRFDFREMEPRPELLDDISVEGVSVGGLLRVMNERIEVLLDRDHRLGHAHFIGLREVATITELARIFRSNVVPLLQEYFFEDYERVRWILNDHRKPPELQFLIASESTASELLGDEASPRNRPVRWTLNEKAFHLPAAYAAIVASST